MVARKYVSLNIEYPPLPRAFLKILKMANMSPTEPAGKRTPTSVRRRSSRVDFRLRNPSSPNVVFVRTPFPGSRPRHFFPSRTGPLIPLKNSSTASAEEFYYSFYYNEGLENKLTRAPLLGLAKSICYI